MPLRPATGVADRVQPSPDIESGRRPWSVVAPCAPRAPCGCQCVPAPALLRASRLWRHRSACRRRNSRRRLQVSPICGRVCVAVVALAVHLRCEQPRAVAASGPCSRPVVGVGACSLRQRSVGSSAYGDRLKITFFESIGVALQRRHKPARISVAAIFPRMDLSAEYAVDEGGGVNMPRLGRFAATGQAIAALQSALAAAFERAIGRTERCAGRDRRAPADLRPRRGAQRGHLQAHAGHDRIAGARQRRRTRRGAADTSRAIENIRETERLRQTRGPGWTPAC